MSNIILPEFQTTCFCIVEDGDANYFQHDKYSEDGTLTSFAVQIVVQIKKVSKVKALESFI